jgi:polyisoprenoid-binding protein YceI
LTSNRIAAVAAGALAALAGLPSAVAAEEATTFRFVSPSEVHYLLKHTLHPTHGTSGQIDGKVEVVLGAKPHLVFPVVLSIPVKSFDSRNRNRDRNMAMVMDVLHYEKVTLRLDSGKLAFSPTGDGRYSVEGPVSGELAMHGVSKAVSLKLTGSVGPDRLEVESHFPVSLTAFGVERPALLGWKTDDDVMIDVKGTAKP